MLQVESTAIVGRVAEHQVVAEGGRGADDVYPTAELATGVATGEAQPLDGRADVAGDVDDAPATQSVQSGGIGRGVGRVGETGGVTAPNSDGLADVDCLGDPGASLHSGAIAGHLDHVSGLGAGVHCRLDGGIIRGIVVESDPAVTHRHRSDVADSRLAQIIGSGNHLVVVGIRREGHCGRERHSDYPLGGIPGATRHSDVGGVSRRVKG